MGRRKHFLKEDDPMTRATWLMLAVIAAEVAVLLWAVGLIKPLA